MPDINENAILHLAGKPPRPATDSEAQADYADAKQRFVHGIEHSERTSENITLRMLAALVVASDDLVPDKARMLHWLADQVN